MQDNPDFANDPDFDNEQTWLEAGLMRRGQPAPFATPPAEAAAATPARFRLDWLDRHREPVGPPDPTYPHGVAIDVALDAMKACRVELPCPAARCGLWVVVCQECGFAIALATAGRADDPCSVRVPCRLH